MNRRVAADALIVACPFCHAAVGRRCRNAYENVMLGSHIQRTEIAEREAAARVEESTGDASVVNKDQPAPTFRRALADAFEVQRQANTAVMRARYRVESGCGSWAEYRPFKAAADEADLVVDGLVFANAAHELEWAHLADLCPLCKGEVGA